MRRRPSLERRVLGLVGEARLAVGSYGQRPVIDQELNLLTRVFNIECGSAPLSVPAMLLPPVEGKFQVIFQEGLGRAVRRYITLHELGHVLAGEAEEPMQMVFEGPLPDNEDVADLFALLGIIDPVHDQEGPEWIEQQIRQAVPLDDRGWQVHRIPRLSRKLAAVRQMVFDRLDS